VKSLCAMKRILLAAGAFVALTSVAARSDVTSPDVRVSTISGSGASGYSDGSQFSARYMLPFGVDSDVTGRIYVSDAAAQRIRVIERDGSVRTLAGSGTPIANGLWVQGGFRNGPGAQAQFDHPAGIVVAADGALYVADTNNRCIRRIDASGNVTTYAGVPGAKGYADGPRLSATLFRPTGLSSDARGNLYIADYFGIRVVSPSGDVTTMPRFASTPFGVSVFNTPAGPVIFASDLLGIVRRSASGAVERFPIEHLSTGRLTQGLEPLGYPFGIAAFDDHSVVFTDPRSNTVRYLNWTAGALQTLAGVDVLDGAASTGGYRDGAGSVSRFDAPLGVAVTKEGAIVVADAGSKRIRMISRLDRSHDQRPGGLPNANVDEAAYKIAFVGNSYLWIYQRWSDSIEGIVERRVTSAYPKARIRVQPFVFPGTRFDAQEQYAQMLGENGLANFVVLNLNPLMLVGTGGLSADREQLESQASTWEPFVTRALHATYEELRSRHVGFLVVTSPMPDIAPSENIWNELTEPNGGTAPHVEVAERLNEAAKRSGAPMLDVTSLFERELRSPQHAPLFGTEDTHFSAHGRAVMGDAVANYLLMLHPWRLH